MPQWQKPENALRRANELLEVGKKQDALDTLHDVIKARKHRQWTKIHELIMTKHLELCVELRKPHLAKDGLFQYRNMCQQVNVKSLEDVIGSFLEMAEKKADQAREDSHGLVEDVEDLDQAESPEKLLLSAVSGEGAQDRADRAVLSPWLRFLWESYRQCLELLRNNVQVETLYHKVAKQAFQFCLKYQRKAEFRKLCDNLRTHLNQIQKSQHAHFALKLSNPETLAMHQDTRLIQLDVAIQMELWQEAFKSAEDVHQLMQLSKRQAKASTLASYYEKLALIFWKAGNVLYHAAALMKLLQLTKELKKSVSVEESTHLATRTLLSTLSIQWTGVGSDLSRHLEMDEIQTENQRRLASLIMMPSPPSRQSLMKDVIRLNVNNMAQPAAQQLYHWLEVKFDPLKLASEIEKHLNVLTELGKIEYAQYVDSLKQVTALKVLKQVSQVYQTVTFTFLSKILPFFDIYQMERLIVGAGKKAQMQVRLHHRTESVEFGVAEGLSFGGEEEEASSLLASSQLNVPIVQTMPNEQIRQHLQQMYAALQDALESVDTDARKHVMEQLRNQLTFYNYHAVDQHKRTLERKKRIEMYKEVAEKIKNEQEEQQKEHDRLITEQKVRETNQRLEQDKADRMERQKREQEEAMKMRMMQDRLERMKDPKLKKLIEDMPEDDLQNMDAETLLQKQISHLEQEKREQIAKLKQQEKKWDYLVRAMHMEEIPLREEEYKFWAIDDRKMWEEYETDRIQKATDEHRFMIDSYNRLHRMEADADEVVASIRLARASDFKQRVVDWEKKLKETREKRLKERRDERKAKRRAEWLEQKKEEEKRKREEEEKQRREIENKRATGDRGTFQRRGPEQDNRDSGAEPSGADADQWVRMGPQASADRSNLGRPGLIRGADVPAGGRPVEGGAARPAWSGQGMQKTDEDQDWRARQGPIEPASTGGQGFRRPPPSDGDSEPLAREAPRAEPDWTVRQGPLEPTGGPTMERRPPFERPPLRGPANERTPTSDRMPPMNREREREPEPDWGRRQGPLEVSAGAGVPSSERRYPDERPRPPPAGRSDGYNERRTGDVGGEREWRRQGPPADDVRPNDRPRYPPDDRARPPPAGRSEGFDGGRRYGDEGERDWRRKEGPPTDDSAPSGRRYPDERPRPPPAGRSEGYSERRYGDGGETNSWRRGGPADDGGQNERRYPDERPRGPPPVRSEGYDSRRYGDDKENDWRQRQGPPADDRGPSDRRGPNDRTRPPMDRSFEGRHPMDRGSEGRPPMDRGSEGRPPMDRGSEGRHPMDRGSDSRPPMDRGNDGYGRRAGPPPSDQYARSRPRDEPRSGDNRDQSPEEEGWARVPPKRR